MNGRVFGAVRIKISNFTEVYSSFWKKITAIKNLTKRMLDILNRFRYDDGNQKKFL